MSTGDPLARLRLLVVAGERALAKPRRLRGRLLHVAGRITRSGRRRTSTYRARGRGRRRASCLATARLRSLAAPCRPGESLPSGRGTPRDGFSLRSCALPTGATNPAHARPQPPPAEHALPAHQSLHHPPRSPQPPASCGIEARRRG